VVCWQSYIYTPDQKILQEIPTYVCGPGSSVGIATELRAGRSGIDSRWARDFPPFQTGPGAHPASSKMGTGSFPGVKSGRDVLLTTHHLLVPRSWKSRAILSGPHRACNGNTLTYLHIFSIILNIQINIGYLKYLKHSEPIVLVFKNYDKSFRNRTFTHLLWTILVI